MSSLFPAYGALNSDNVNTADAECKVETGAAKTEWLDGMSSYTIETAAETGRAQTGEDRQPIEIDSENSSDDSSQSSTPSDDEVIVKSKIEIENNIKSLEFDGKEEFYIDKRPERSYLNIKTLHKPIRPRYSVRMRMLKSKEAEFQYFGASKSHKRHKPYYKCLSMRDEIAGTTSMSELERSKHIARISQLNGKVLDEPENLSNWLELYELNKMNLYKIANGLMLAERQLHIINSALKHHRSNEQLLRRYIEVANANFPSNEVSSMLDTLLTEDPYNYTLWTAQIMATQGTMARCNIPDVLQIYERSMHRMHRVPHQSALDINTDPIMLALFHNCALFLRQAGNYEQFFALIKLALELNIAGVNFDNLTAKVEDERTLIDYEELILQSGLPMNEIWLRVEKLRQSYCFLPYQADDSNGASATNPQRCVFNEDVCHYIYPLKTTNNALQLMLLIVQLTKLPFVTSHCLAERLCARIEYIGDSDAIEMILAVAGQRSSYALSLKEQNQYLKTLNDLAKEMAVSPTFLSHSIGHELYANCISELLLKCSAAYTGAAELEPKRRIFMLLWFRFQRLRMVLEKLSGKLTEEYVRAGRAQMKSLIKQPANRNTIAYYIEFGLYEYEAIEDEEHNNMQSAFKIFDNIIVQANFEATNQENQDMMHAHVIYAELLLARNQHEQAMQLLTSLALSKSTNQPNSSSMLAGIERLLQSISRAIEEEQHREASEFSLTEYFTPNKIILLLKARCLLLWTLGQNEQALCYLDELLNKHFPATVDTERKRYVREQIYELYMVLLELPIKNAMKTSRHVIIITKLTAALNEFPRNLHFLQRWGMLSTLPWYKLRAHYLKIDANILSILYLIASARFRFLQAIYSDSGNNHLSPTLIPSMDRSSLETMARNRILNVLNTMSTNNKETATKYAFLKRNALYWRFYLRCLSDRSTSFEKVTQCLLTALDECPWNKAIYLDGATYVPQESAHMQDLMSEKLLRVYALPEELEILRNVYT